MDIQTYSELAMRTCGTDGEGRALLNAGLGLAGEAGEVADAIKKVAFHDKLLDRDHLIAEAGDICWYLNLLIVTLGTTWDEVLSRNIRKLEARYPELRFSAERANNRDTDAEAAAMRGVV